MADATVAQHLAVWADLVSIALLIATVSLAGMQGLEWNPRRRVWGHNPVRTAFVAIFMLINTIFSVGRFIAEAVLVEIGPREFLLLSVTYSARWLWLFIALHKGNTRAAKAFEVARALRELKTVRFGKSTHPSRLGKDELVIRKGTRAFSSVPDMYWRGHQEHVHAFDENRNYLVRLVEKDLHSEFLDEIGTVSFKQKLDTDGVDILYKKIYDLIRSVDGMNPNFVVNYEPFLRTYKPISADARIAQRVGATDTTQLGEVARRICSDACYYTKNFRDAEFRTESQVLLVNSCLEIAATEYIGVSMGFGNDAIV